MIRCAKEQIVKTLRWSERYTKTDMVYLASSGFWLTSGRLFSVASGTLLTIAFANLFSPTSFGTYKYVLSIAGVVGAFSLGGLGGAVTRAIAQGNIHIVRAVFRVSVLWSIPASAVALAGSAYYFWNGNVHLGTGLLLIAITNPFLNGFTLWKSTLLGAQDFRGLTMYGMPRALIPVALLLGTLLMTQEVPIILAVYFFSNLLVGWVIYEMTLRKHHIGDGGTGVGEIVTYGKHMSVMGALSQAVGNLDQLLLWHFAGPVQLAIYAFALAPIRELRSFPENIYPIIFPKMATKTVEEMKRTVPLRMKQLLLVSCLIAGIYIFLAPLLYTIVFPQYVTAIFASQLLALTLVLQPRGVVETMLYVEGNTKIRYVTIFVTQGAKVILWVILIPLYGIMGAVIGTVVTDIVSSLALWWAYKKLV
ncbi:MAG: oligosaccharide flippase family protein [Patescibacteria group bacterium]